MVDFSRLPGVWVKAFTSPAETFASEKKNIDSFFGFNTTGL